MYKIVFGTPEKHTPTAYCRPLNYQETGVNYPVSRIRYKQTQDGCILEFPFSDEECFYGMGLQMYSFNHKGRNVLVRVNSDPVRPTGDSHAPVPFFVSTKGYGIFVDTARYAEFRFGVQTRESAAAEINEEIQTSTEGLYQSRISGDRVIGVYVPHAQGVTVYVIEGATILDVVKQYNVLSGGGPDVPDWALGTFYRCYAKNTADEVIEMGRYLKEHDLPVSVIGLEPGWQSHAYSCTYTWNPEKFPEEKRTAMFAEMRKMGYHLNLWEHAFVNEGAPFFKDVLPGSGSYRVWNGLVPDFTIRSTRDAFARHHRENVINDVVDGFKLDECDSGDYVHDWSFPNFTVFPSGMNGEQYHSLFGTLYMQTVVEALDGKKTLGECRSMHALCTSYPFVLYSDLYGQKEFIQACVNSGFSGLLWTPELRDAHSAEELIRRLQNTVFSAHCLINAWYCEKAPWLDLDCEDAVRRLLQIREGLKPRLRKAFDRYRDEGVPPVRALVCEYTDDKATYDVNDEYLFCDDLLVAPVISGQSERQVYLPAGKWVHYLDGRAFEAGSFRYTCRDPEDLPVFRRLS